MSRTLALVALWSIGGCAVNDDTTNSKQAITTENGISLNGISLNGISLNGISLNGISLNGTPIGAATSGPPLAGAGLVGSTWTGHGTSGTTITLRLDAAQQGTGANADVWSYLVSASSGGAWQPLCVDSAGNPAYADSVAGSWNLAVGTTGGGSYNAGTSDFTLACRGSTIAKCVELGYKAWTGATRELAACVRALRGDYCGDGTPYTVNGTLVNIFDDAGIQSDGAAWDPEAAWSPSGALCVSKKKAARFDQDAHIRPWCYPHAVKPDKSCGTGFTTGVTIITELPPL